MLRSRRERTPARKGAGICAIILAFSAPAALQAQPAPFTAEDGYLPDFSYAGYQFGEKAPALDNPTVIEATEYGVQADDGKDDSVALKKALAVAHDTSGPVVLQLPAGRIIVSDILYLERSQMVLRGQGSGATELYFPRPLQYLPDPPDLQELREYLIAQDKRQREKANHIDLAFSQYSWAGGFIWTRVPGQRVKAYLEDYNQPQASLAHAIQGQRGDSWLTVDADHSLKAGQIISINWHNRDGEDGPLLKALYPYPHNELNIGSHHWTLPDQPLVKQPVLITEVDGNRIRIKDTLLHDIEASGGHTEITDWPHLTEVGIERLSLTFPRSPMIAHHVEPGYNGLFLTRVFNGWVNDLRIRNADSGILTEEVANLTLENVTTSGENLAHYSIAMGDTHNVLVKHLKVHNEVRHPLSFNTYSTRSIYTQSQVLTAPVLDQHSGANHQNLFDDIEVLVHLDKDQRERARYPLFKGGGASYWKPTHGAYNTFWNIRVQLDTYPADSERPLALYGVSDGPQARLLGVHGNYPLEVDYGPDAVVRGLNAPPPGTPSLYEYQLRQRLDQP